MGKAFAILLIVLGVWLGLEIFTKGTDQAFGGIFASSDASAQHAPAEPTAQRIRNKVQRDMEAGAARAASGTEELDQVPDDEDGATDEYGSNE